MKWMKILILFVDEQLNFMNEEGQQEATKEIGTQTDPVFDQNETDGMAILFCSSDKNDVSTQTTITINTGPMITSKKVIVKEVVSDNEINCKQTVSRNVGPDAEMHTVFSGFDSVCSDEAMKTLGGVSLLFFDILLEFIVPGKDGQPMFFKKVSQKSRLLLFLMKMKLGLSFTALSYIFQVSRQTTSNIFFSVLETLLKITKNWLFWPSKQAIKETMPITFANYPDCRAIIDCTELACETPPKLSFTAACYLKLSFSKPG